MRKWRVTCSPGVSPFWMFTIIDPYGTLRGYAPSISVAMNNIRDFYLRSTN